MMNNPFSVFFNHLTDRRRKKRAQEYREFLDTYYASHRWTLVKCSKCEEPATAPDAKFCAFCGSSLMTARVQAGLQALSNIGTHTVTFSSSKLHPAFEQERTIGPVQIQKRPMLAYLEKKDQMEQRNTGPQTNYHRAIHLEKIQVK